MKTRRAISAIASLAGLALIATLVPGTAIGLPSTGSPDWTRVSITGLAADSQATYLWAPEAGSLYAWTDSVLAGTTSVPEARLFHWNRGVWSEQLRLPGFTSSAVYGTGPQDVFAAATGCLRHTQAECGPSAHSVMFHFDGDAWAQQPLPAQVGTGTVGQISGFPGEVQAAVIGTNLILGYDGTAWSVLFGPTGPGQVGPQQLSMVAPDEGYCVGCIGYGWWNGAAWNQSASHVFCDVYDVWGTRSQAGVATVYSVGNQGFSNGIRVWRGDEQAAVPPLSFNSVFSAGNQGTGLGVWGSGPSDIYVVGRQGESDGAVLHFDGADWQSVEVGAIPIARDVWGSGPNDVWVSLADGTLAHYGLTYQFQGFLPPLRAGLNKATAGQAVPVKFQLAGERSIDVLAAGFPVSRPVSCDGTQPQAAVPTASPGASRLTRDPATGQYTYVWKTEKSWAGTCREFILRLDDGSEHKALMAFK